MLLHPSVNLNITTSPGSLPTAARLAAAAPVSMHVSVYEVISRRPPTAGDATVNIFSGGRPDRPLVLVLVSYEPVNWILKLPSDVTISRVILVRTQKRQLYDK